MNIKNNLKKFSNLYYLNVFSRKNIFSKTIFTTLSNTHFNYVKYKYIYLLR